MVGRKLSKREQFLVAMATGMTLVVFCYQFLYLPYAMEREKLQGEIIAATEELEDALALVEREESIRTSHRQLQQSEKEVRLLLPSAKSLPQLILQIDAAAQVSGIELLSLMPGDIADEDGIGKYSFSVTCRGEQRQMFSFLEALEDFPRFMRVIAIQFTPDLIGGFVKGNFQLEVFFIPADSLVSEIQDDNGL